MSSAERPQRMTLREWLVPIGLAGAAVAAYVGLYLARRAAWLTPGSTLDQMWWDLSGTLLTAAVVVATLDRASKRDLEEFVRTLSRQQQNVAAEILKQQQNVAAEILKQQQNVAEDILKITSVRALLSEKMSPLVFQAIQQQILDMPVVVRDYQLFMHISKRGDTHEYVNVAIHERYRLCNESPETRVLPISCSIDLDYEDRFTGANRLVEIVMVKDSLKASLAEATEGELITLREEDLERCASKRGQTVAYDVSTPEVAPGADILVLRTRTKVLRATDTNFWRAAQPMESVELTIDHDEDLEVEAFLVEPWNVAAHRVHRGSGRSRWIMTKAVLPHQGFDISWQPVSTPG
jgi:hypothetical protein